MLKKLSPVQESPEPISDDELYDPPEPELEPPGLASAPWEPPREGEHDLPHANWKWQPQNPDPAPPQPPMPSPKPKDDVRAAAFSAALDILSFRLILLLCVGSSAGLFGVSALWPDEWRLASAIAFSLIVTGPCMYFYRKAE